MDWVLLEKFEQVGTAQGSMRAEIVADKKLVASRARQSQREDKLRSSEHILLKYSRCVLFARCMLIRCCAVCACGLTLVTVLVSFVSCC